MLVHLLHIGSDALHNQVNNMLFGDTYLKSNNGATFSELKIFK